MASDLGDLTTLWISSSPHEALKPLEWLVGKWKSVSAEGSFPTISPFTYCEEITFTSYGQPMLNYNSVSWHPVKKCPMHLESGFLRIQPGTNNLAFMVAHNFGLSTLEEGELLANNQIKLTSVNVLRMSFAKDPAVIKIERSLQLVNGKLELSLAMQTANTETFQHLKAIYEKIA